MEAEGYELSQGEDKFKYEFYSIGPKGQIRKIIEFQQVNAVRSNLFNLSLSDVDNFSGQLNDSVISNNGDYQKIMVTVANAVFNFLEFRSNAIIILEGNSFARTRLFQMGISSFSSWMDRRYEIYGRKAKEWFPFVRGTNYHAFLVFRKIL